MDPKPSRPSRILSGRIALPLGKAVVFATIGLTGALLLVPGIGVARILPAVFLIFVAPGYLAGQCFWTNAEAGGRGWLLSMVLPLSISLDIVALLLAHYSGTYTYPRLVIALILMNCVLAAIAMIRGWEGYSSRTLTGVLDLMLRWSKAPVAWIKAAALFLCIGSLGFSILYAATSPREPSPLTELYLVGSDGGFLYAIQPSDRGPSTLRIGVGNREGALTQYRLEVTAPMAGQQVYLASASFTVMADATEIETISIEQPLDAFYFVDVSLYKGDDEEAYRSLRVSVQPH